MSRVLATGILWVALLPQIAAAAIPQSADPGDAVSMRGRFCTFTSCAGRPAQPWSTALGFAAAAVASGWIGRRRTRACG
jgi:hypothetical protein